MFNRDSHVGVRFQLPFSIIAPLPSLLINTNRGTLSLSVSPDISISDGATPNPGTRTFQECVSGVVRRATSNEPVNVISNLIF